MTLEFVVNVSPDLKAIEAAVGRLYGLSHVPPMYGHWRGHGVWQANQFPNVCVRGKAFCGGSCICLDVGTSSDEAAAWLQPVCHAKVFKTGHIKLMGCRSYGMANEAVQKLVAIIQHTQRSSKQVLVRESSTHLINAVFEMAPFCKDDRIIDKEQLNDLARDAGFHVHSGAGDGKPYIKFVLEEGTKALVYVSGKVWVTGCRSVEDLGKAVQQVQSFVDAHAEQLLNEDD